MVGLGQQCPTVQHILAISQSRILASARLFFVVEFVLAVNFMPFLPFDSYFFLNVVPPLSLLFAISNPIQGANDPIFGVLLLFMSVVNTSRLNGMDPD